MPPEYSPGLEGIVAAETRLSRIDGEAGELWIAGVPVETLAAKAAFEETLHLLWHDRLPTPPELDALRQSLAQRRALPAPTLELLRAAARAEVEVMDALMMGIASLKLTAAEEPETLALELVAASAVLVATYWRLLQGQEPIPADEELGHAANYLYMLTGEAPEPRRVRALESYLATVVDHGMNASTFTARVIVSTRSDLVSAIAGAVGALKGPLHGGAPGPALDLVFEIGSPERAPAVLRRKIEAGERLMGFGHRVYRVRDPRAEVLAAAARELYAGSDEEGLYDLALAVERSALELLAELKPKRRLDTNVEYYTALVLHGIGLSNALFSPTFAVGRVGGWTAHALEQLAEGRLIRPSARYVGGGPKPWTPLAERGIPVSSVRR